MWRRNVNYDRFVAIRCVFSSSKYSKTRFSPGLCPGLRWGAYDAPQTPSSAGEGILPILFPLVPFGVSILAPMAPRLSGPRIQIPGYTHDRVGAHIARGVTFLQKVGYQLSSPPSSSLPSPSFLFFPSPSLSRLPFPFPSLHPFPSLPYPLPFPPST